MVEVMVAAAIVLVAVLAIAYTATIAFSDIAFARQRQSATGLADQTMEQIRALPFDTLARGLANADLSATAGTSDKNIVVKTGDCVTGIGSGTVYCYNNEQIARGDDPNVVPLVPHQQAITVGQTSYKISVYITFYGNDASSNALRATVFVSWSNVERKGLSGTVQTQSTFATPGGCLSTATHPFAAPCQPFLYATSVRDQGHINVTGSIEGISLDHASVWIPGFGSAVQVEQLSAIQGVAQTSGAAIQAAGGTETVLSRQVFSSGADNDPAEPKPAWNSVPPSVSQSSQTSSLTDGDNTISVTTSAGDSALTTSTVSATTSPSQPCPNVTGMTNLTNGLPCGGSTSQMGGSTSVTLTLTPNGSNIGSANIVNVTAPTCVPALCANRSAAYRFLAPTSGMCPGTSGDGCTHAEATRNIGKVQLGALPGAFAGPSGWQGYYVRLGNFSDSVSSEAGIGSAAGTGTAPAAGTGLLSYWNGTGYTNCTIYGANCPPSGGNFPISAFTWTTTVDGDPMVFTMTAALSTGGRPVPVQTPSCAGTCTRNTSSVVSGAPLLGTVTYTVVYNGQTIANLTLQVDLGTLRATSQYQAAPSGA